LSEDPYRHHPVLRDRITDPEASFFRNFRPSDLDARMRERGIPDGWRRSEAEIEASRVETLAGHGGGDLWFFGYGSLMWDPAVRFAEVRHGRAIGYRRSFCLYDTLGARGTEEQPGLMAALDLGDFCDGLVFRIDADRLEEETPVLWRREYIAPAYKPAFIDVETGPGAVTALAFVADHGADMIRTDLSHAEQVRLIATGTGFLGSSLEYIENLADHFSALEINDPHISGLLEDARAWRQP
jgi:cation transport protein ChaC